MNQHVMACTLVALGCASAASASDAERGVPLESERLIGAFALVGAGPVEDSVVVTHQGLFDDSVSITLDEPNAYAEVSAYQNSDITPSGFVYAGGGLIEFMQNAPFLLIVAESSAALQFTIDATQPVQIDLESFGSDTLVVIDGPSGTDFIDVVEPGETYSNYVELIPGEYTFRFQQTVTFSTSTGAPASVSHAFGSQGTFRFVPAPGALLALAPLAMVRRRRNKAARS